MWNNTVERGRPQMTTWRMRIACWIPKATNTICNNYCYSTKTMIARMLLDVTLHVHCLSCSLNLCKKTGMVSSNRRRSYPYKTLLTAVRHIYPSHSISIVCAVDSLSLNNLGLSTISAIYSPHNFAHHFNPLNTELNPICQ